MLLGLVMAQRELSVFMSLDGADCAVGRLWSRDSKTSTFVYDPAWLAHPQRFDLSPALPCVSAPHQISSALPVAFSDCAPDGWGQKLMRRGERTAADQIGRPARILAPIDFLAGVDDWSRMGALRFKDPNGVSFLSSGCKPVPPLIDLPVLMGAADKVDRGKGTKRDVDLVLDPGASLGGARPKASVRGTSGNLLIAKFPKTDDGWPVISWEAVTLDLAQAAGIDVPEWTLQTVARKAVLLLDRFDRKGVGARVPFMSAMTALDAKDHADGHSYLEIVAFIRRYGNKPDAALQQLWRRMVFNILVSNTDDHLRNHAFLRDARGWRLTPAFDMNPSPLGKRTHAIAIDERDNSGSFNLALSVAPQFGISKADAANIGAEVGAAVAKWREVAKRHKITPSQISFMAIAFEHGDVGLAQRNSTGVASSSGSKPATTSKSKPPKSAAKTRTKPK